MQKFRNHLLMPAISAMSAFFICAVPGHTQDAPVSVSDKQISAITSGCAGGASSAACQTAIQALVEELRTTNSGTQLSTVIGSITASIADMSNRSITGNVADFNKETAAAALRAVAAFARRNALGPLANTVLAMAKNVSNSVEIDLGAIASGSGVIVEDKDASPS